MKRKKQEDERARRKEGGRANEKKKGVREVNKRRSERRKLEEKEVRCERLKCSFVQQFVDAIADLPQRQSVLLSVPIQLSQEFPMGKMVENVIDACM